MPTYTFIKDKKNNFIYASVEGDIELELEVIKIEADTIQQAFAISDPDYIKRQEKELEELKAAIEATKQVKE
jgi:hypothetical protein